MHVQIKLVKGNVEWSYSNLEISNFFNLSKIYFTEFFLIFPVSSVYNKNIFIKKYGVTGLGFKMDAIDGKKWVKFAMQQDSATLIYDLNTTVITIITERLSGELL